MDSEEFENYIFERFPNERSPKNKSPNVVWPGLAIHQPGMTLSAQPFDTLMPRLCIPASYSYSSPKCARKDSEVKRKKRLALYDSYAVEGRMKVAVKKGVSWMKRRYEFLVHGC